MPVRLVFLARKDPPGDGALGTLEGLREGGVEGEAADAMTQEKQSFRIKVAAAIIPILRAAAKETAGPSRNGITAALFELGQARL